MSNNPTITASPSYEPGIAKWYDTIRGEYSVSNETSGTSEADSMDETTIPLFIPDGYKATINADLTVDDWGWLTISNTQGEEKLRINLTSNESPAGPRGGHTEWSSNSSATLDSGSYVITVHHENVTYSTDYDPKHNVAKCNFAITATKSPAPHPVESTYVITSKFGYITTVFLKSTVKFSATCSGGSQGEQTFSNLKVTSVAQADQSWLLKDNKVARILVKNVTATLVGSPVYDSKTGVTAQNVSLSWTMQRWDPYNPDSQGEVEEFQLNSTQTAIQYGTIFCSH